MQTLMIYFMGNKLDKIKRILIITLYKHKK